MIKEALPRIGVFVCDCGSNIAGTVDTAAVEEYARTLPGVVAVVRNKYTCAEPGQEEIKKAIVEDKLERVVVASCTPRMHEPTFRKALEADPKQPAALLGLARILVRRGDLDAVLLALPDHWHAIPAIAAALPVSAWHPPPELMTVRLLPSAAWSKKVS